MMGNNEQEFGDVLQQNNCQICFQLFSDDQQLSQQVLENDNHNINIQVCLTCHSMTHKSCFEAKLESQFNYKYGKHRNRTIDCFECHGCFIRSSTQFEAQLGAFCKFCMNGTGILIPVVQNINSDNYYNIDQNQDRQMSFSHSICGLINNLVFYNKSVFLDNQVMAIENQECRSCQKQIFGIPLQCKQNNCNNQYHGYCYIQEKLRQKGENDNNYFSVQLKTMKINQSVFYEQIVKRSFEIISTTIEQEKQMEYNEKSKQLAMGVLKHIGLIGQKYQELFDAQTCLAWEISISCQDHDIKLKNELGHLELDNNDEIITENCEVCKKHFKKDSYKGLHRLCLKCNTLLQLKQLFKQNSPLINQDVILQQLKKMGERIQFKDYFDIISSSQPMALLYPIIHTQQQYPLFCNQYFTSDNELQFIEILIQFVLENDIISQFMGTKIIRELQQKLQQQQQFIEIIFPDLWQHFNIKRDYKKYQYYFNLEKSLDYIKNIQKIDNKLCQKLFLFKKLMNINFINRLPISKMIIQAVIFYTKANSIMYQKLYEHHANISVSENKLEYIITHKINIDFLQKLVQEWGSGNYFIQILFPFFLVFYNIMTEKECEEIFNYSFENFSFTKEKKEVNIFVLFEQYLRDKIKKQSNFKQLPFQQILQNQTQQFYTINDSPILDTHIINDFIYDMKQYYTQLQNFLTNDIETKLDINYAQEYNIHTLEQFLAKYKLNSESEEYSDIKQRHALSVKYYDQFLLKLKFCVISDENLNQKYLRTQKITNDYIEKMQSKRLYYDSYIIYFYRLMIHNDVFEYYLNGGSSSYINIKQSLDENNKIKKLFEEAFTDSTDSKIIIFKKVFDLVYKQNLQKEVSKKLMSDINIINEIKTVMNNYSQLGKMHKTQNNPIVLNLDQIISQSQTINFTEFHGIKTSLFIIQKVIKQQQQQVQAYGDSEIPILNENKMAFDNITQLPYVFYFIQQHPLQNTTITKQLTKIQQQYFRNLLNEMKMSKIINFNVCCEVYNLKSNDIFQQVWQQFFNSVTQEQQKQLRKAIEWMQNFEKLLKKKTTINFFFQLFESKQICQNIKQILQSLYEKFDYYAIFKIGKINNVAEDNYDVEPLQIESLYSHYKYINNLILCANIFDEESSKYVYEFLQAMSKKVKNQFHLMTPFTLNSDNYDKKFVHEFPKYQIIKSMNLMSVNCSNMQKGVLENMEEYIIQSIKLHSIVQFNEDLHDFFLLINSQQDHFINSNYDFIQIFTQARQSVQELVNVIKQLEKYKKICGIDLQKAYNILQSHQQLNQNAENIIKMLKEHNINLQYEALDKAKKEILNENMLRKLITGERICNPFIDNVTYSDIYEQFLNIRLMYRNCPFNDTNIHQSMQQLEILMFFISLIYEYHDRQLLSILLDQCKKLQITQIGNIIEDYSNFIHIISKQNVILTFQNHDQYHRLNYIIDNSTYQDSDDYYNKNLKLLQYVHICLQSIKYNQEGIYYVSINEILKHQQHIEEKLFTELTFQAIYENVKEQYGENTDNRFFIEYCLQNCRDQKQFVTQQMNIYLQQFDQFLQTVFLYFEVNQDILAKMEGKDLELRILQLLFSNDQNLKNQLIKLLKNVEGGLSIIAFAEILPNYNNIFIFIIMLFLVFGEVIPFVNDKKDEQYTNQNMKKIIQYLFTNEDKILYFYQNIKTQDIIIEAEDNNQIFDDLDNLNTQKLIKLETRCFYQFKILTNSINWKISIQPQIKGNNKLETEMIQINDFGKKIQMLFQLMIQRSDNNTRIIIINFLQEVDQFIDKFHFDQLSQTNKSHQQKKTIKLLQNIQRQLHLAENYDRQKQQSSSSFQYGQQLREYVNGKSQQHQENFIQQWKQGGQNLINYLMNDQTAQQDQKLVIDETQYIDCDEIQQADQSHYSPAPNIIQEKKDYRYSSNLQGLLGQETLMDQMKKEIKKNKYYISQTAINFTDSFIQKLNKDIQIFPIQNIVSNEKLFQFLENYKNINQLMVDYTQYKVKFQDLMMQIKNHKIKEQPEKKQKSKLIKRESFLCEYYATDQNASDDIKKVKTDNASTKKKEINNLNQIIFCNNFNFQFTLQKENDKNREVKVFDNIKIYSTDDPNKLSKWYKMNINPKFFTNINIIQSVDVIKKYEDQKDLFIFCYCAIPYETIPEKYIQLINENKAWSAACSKQVSIYMVHAYLLRGFQQYKKIRFVFPDKINSVKPQDIFYLFIKCKFEEQSQMSQKSVDVIDLSHILNDSEKNKVIKMFHVRVEMRKILKLDDKPPVKEEQQQVNQVIQNNEQYYENQFQQQLPINFRRMEQDNVQLREGNILKQQLLFDQYPIDMSKQNYSQSNALMQSFYNPYQQQNFVQGNQNQRPYMQQMGMPPTLLPIYPGQMMQPNNNMTPNKDNRDLQTNNDQIIFKDVDQSDNNEQASGEDVYNMVVDSIKDLSNDDLQELYKKSEKDVQEILMRYILENKPFLIESLSRTNI